MTERRYGSHYPLTQGRPAASIGVSLLFLVLAAAALSGANFVIIAFAQELVPSRAGTASSLVMALGWGVAGVFLIGYGSGRTSGQDGDAVEIGVVVFRFLSRRR
jgi:hypothetical protein